MSVVGGSKTMTTPGLFKEEYKGTGAVAVNSKTYVCWDSVKSTSKASSKGISKRLNKLTADVYKSVLQTQQPFTGINRGFIREDLQMVTYKQSQAGITYYYAKIQIKNNSGTKYSDRWSYVLLISLKLRLEL